MTFATLILLLDKYEPAWKSGWGFPAGADIPPRKGESMGACQIRARSDVCLSEPRPIEGGPYIPEHFLRQRWFFGGLLRRLFEGYDGVVVERAVLLKRRVGQKVVKAENVSLLSLSKERKEQP